MKLRKNILVITILVIVLSFMGCNNSNKNEKKETKNDYQVNGELGNNSLILTINDQQVGYDEVKVYMQELKNNYEQQFGTSIWDFDLGNGTTFEDKAKDEIIDQIVQLKIIGKKAVDLGVSLTEDEKDEISLQVKEFMNGLSKDYIAENAITEELITTVYSDNYLASKVFDVATNSVDTDISDEEAKQITTWQIFVQTNGEDKNGNQVMLSEAEKKTALKRAKKLLKEAKDTDDFYALAEKNTDDVDVELTFGKGEQPAEIENAAFALKKGEVSDLIENDLGYYIIYCVSNYNEEATATKKEEIIAKRQDEEFQKLYTSWSEDYKVAVNKQMWDKVKFIENTEQEDKTNSSPDTASPEDNASKESDSQGNDANGDTE